MREEADIVIVGAGPAGLSAASYAGLAARSVLVIDDNPASGGQIWRQPSKDMPYWATDFENLPVRFLQGARAIGSPRPGVLLVEQDNRPIQIDYRSLILATGASERFLP